LRVADFRRVAVFLGHRVLGLLGMNPSVMFRRDVGNGVHAEVVIDGRVYRVRISELAYVWRRLAQQQFAKPGNTDDRQVHEADDRQIHN